MSLATTSHNRSQLEALQHACERGTLAEIELQTPEGEKQFARMRLLGSDNHAVYIDRPTCQGIHIELTSDMSAVVHFMFEGSRYSFHSRIEQESSIPRKNGHRVQGFAMMLPDHVNREERRTDCRASLAHCPEVIAQVESVDHGEVGFEARLMNISAGGIAAIAVDPGACNLQRNNVYSVVFSLPTISRVFHFKTQLRHLRDLNGAGFIMGFAYLPEAHAAETRHAIRQISQFVAKQLKNNGKNPRSSAS